MKKHLPLKKILLSVLILWQGLAWTRPLHSAEVVERILAVVNDEIITEQDLELVMAPVVAQYRTTYTGKEFDGVIDFEAALRDPNDPKRMRMDLDSGDHLNPKPWAPTLASLRLPLPSM